MSLLSPRIKSALTPFTVIVALAITSAPVFAKPPLSPDAEVASIKPTDLVEYKKLKPEMQKLVREALELTSLGLDYRYGSNSIENKGMDCSGTIQRTLLDVGLTKIPRSSYTIYHWAKDAGNLKTVSEVYSLEDKKMAGLMPGDLLFWEGTYTTSTDRVPPISHVMIYLGTLKADGKKVIFGASSGRRFRGKKIHGVSVFDFSMPGKDSKAKFVAYGPVPGLKN